MKKYLYHCVSEETAHIAEDYPWGFRLRTQAKFWIENSHRKDGGQRFVQRTLNPKTGRWCEPKKSTYDPVKIIYLDENGHVQTTRLSAYCNKKDVESFIEEHRSSLSEYQKEILKQLLAVKTVLEKVTYEVRPCSTGTVNLFSKDPEELKKLDLIKKEQEERKLAQKKEMKKIHRAINHVYSKTEI